MIDPVTAVVLAGSRPGTDPLIEGSGVAAKALLPVAGRPMLSYPLDALATSPLVGRVVVYGNDPAKLAEAVHLGGLEVRPARPTIAATVEHALDTLGGPLLVVTGDHVLLTTGMVADFIGNARGADLAIGMVERRVVRRAGFDTRRTWLTFRGGEWSGANLFWLAGAACLPVVQFWASIEQERKKGRKVIAAFGLLTAFLAALRLGSIHQLVRRVGGRFGLRAQVIPMPQAEACIDADKPDDITLIERILAARAE